jgi:hypothetical protein
MNVVCHKIITCIQILKNYILQLCVAYYLHISTSESIIKRLT